MSLFDLEPLAIHHRLDAFRPFSFHGWRRATTERSVRHEPGYYEAVVFGSTECSATTGPTRPVPTHSVQTVTCPVHFEAIERQAEELVLNSKVLVCGIHSNAHMRAAVFH